MGFNHEFHPMHTSRFEAPRTLRLPVGDRVCVLEAGSFFLAPPPTPGLITVNLMAESQHLPSSHPFPIRDYGVPSDPAALGQLFDQLLDDGRPVYVGCFGGKGRTGLFLAALLRHVGQDDGDAVAQVRAWYRPEAVETAEQEAWVRAFPVSPRYATTLAKRSPTP